MTATPPSAVEMAEGLRRLSHEALALARTRPDRPAHAIIHRLMKGVDRQGRDDATPSWWFGAVYEGLIARGAALRRRLGAHYTPMWLVDHLLDVSLDPILSASADPGEVRVLDPACGTGHFLLAAHGRIARELSRRGLAEPEARRRATACLVGVDIDAGAVRVARSLLKRESLGVVNPRVLTADALDWRRGAMDWTSLLRRLDRTGFDVVIGNPPFLNRLRSATAGARSRAIRISAWSGGLIRRYVDEAGAFLLLSLRLARDGGRVGLVLPRSLLATADAAPLREACAGMARITSAWSHPARVFGADVHTCALSFERAGSSARRVVGYAGVPPVRSQTPRVRPASGTSWSALVLGDAPDPSVRSGGVLGDLATATADFRDEYYALRGCIREDKAAPAGWPALVTCGLIDLADCRWWRTTTRVHGRECVRPRVDVGALRALGARSARWVEGRLRPKVLLATQTRVMEVIVDERGEWLPCTPVITVTPRRPGRGELWRIASALASPVSTLRAWREYAGAGLAPEAIKLSARQAMGLPLPSDPKFWGDGADALRRAQTRALEGDEDGRLKHLGEFARAMCAAYGLNRVEGGALEAWWLARLTPRRRRGRTMPTMRA